MEHPVSEWGHGEQKSNNGAGSADVEERPAGADRRANQDERAESADQGRRRNKKRIARMDVVMPTGEVVSQLVREQDREECNRERQSGEKQARTMVRKGKHFEESIEGSRLIVSVGSGKMRAGKEGCEESKKK